MKFKVGDKVKIRKDIAKVTDTYGAGVMPEMDQFAGKFVTILNTYLISYGKQPNERYKINECRNHYSYTLDMFEPTKRRKFFK